jgi:ubiquinone biosynthesis protein COQ4
MGRFFNLRNNLGALYAMVMLGRRPDQVKYVFMIGDRQDNLAEVARAAGQFPDPFLDAELDRMWASKYHPAHYEIAELANLPEDTLGAVYSNFMLARGLEPDFYEDVSPRHKMHYLRLRLRQTHDIWHVLTGFGTDQFGEVGLQGFYFGQVTNGQSTLIFAGAILKSLFRCRFGDLERFVVYFCDGYNAGRESKCLLPVRWEEHWHDSVGALRERHAIRQAPCLRAPMA